MCWSYIFNVGLASKSIMVGCMARLFFFLVLSSAPRHSQFNGRLHSYEGNSNDKNKTDTHTKNEKPNSEGNKHCLALCIMRSTSHLEKVASTMAVAVVLVLLLMVIIIILHLVHLKSFCFSMREKKLSYILYLCTHNVTAYFNLLL